MFDPPIIGIEVGFGLGFFSSSFINRVSSITSGYSQYLGRDFILSPCGLGTGPSSDSISFIKPSSITPLFYSSIFIYFNVSSSKSLVFFKGEVS